MPRNRQMPPWMKTLGHLSPMKWALQSLEGATWRDYAWPELFPPCAMLLAFGAVCFAIGTARLRRSSAT